MSEKKEPLQVIAGASDRPLIIGDIEIPCYVLEDETRVLAQRGVISGLGMARGGSSHGGGDRLAHFVHQKTLRPFISEDLLSVTANPIFFRTPQGNIGHGYPATLLVDLCTVVLEARDAHALTKQQAHIAERADMLIRGFATVGVIALVDEATGYQEIRAKRALATILEKFIAKELQPWTKTFPYEFYQQIFRLKGWDGPHGSKRPRMVGQITSDAVYERLAPKVLEELRKRSPVMPSGTRKNKLFQWFTPDVGHPKLKEHLAAVTALMRAAPNWNAFHRSLERAFPKFKETIPLPFDEG